MTQQTSFNFLEIIKNLFDPLAVQVDIATALTGLITIIVVLWKWGQVIKNQSNRFISEHARESAMNIIQREIQRLSEKRGDIIKSLEYFDNILRIHDGSISRYFIQQDQKAYDKFLIDGKRFSKALREFLDLAQKSKYSIYPLLNSIEGGDDKVKILKEYLQNLANTNDKVLYLTIETDYIVKFLGESDKNQFESHLQKATELVGKYPGGKSALMRDRFDKPYEVLSWCAGEIFLNQSNVRKSSKEYIIVLSSILYVLSLPSHTSDSIENVIDKYKSTKYFDLENEIR